VSDFDDEEEGAFGRTYDEQLREDIRDAALELIFKKTTEVHAVLEWLRGQQLAAPEPRQKPGPKPGVFERVKAAMHETIREHGAEYLRAMKQELMRELYKASPHTCWRAKRAVLSELSSINSDR